MGTARYEEALTNGAIAIKESDLANHDGNCSIRNLRNHKKIERALTARYEEALRIWWSARDLFSYDCQSH